MDTINNEEDIKLLSIVKNDQASNAEKQKAFSRLYNKYQKVLKNYIHQISVGPDEFLREEIFCVTMGKAFTKIHSFNVKFPFVVWLKKIALNTFIDMYRKKHAEKYLQVELTDNIQCYEEQDPFSKIVQKQLKSNIDKFIAELNTKNSEVVKLRLHHNFSCKQISEKLKLPIGTVTTILFRSRLQLLKFPQLKEYYSV